MTDTPRFVPEVDPADLRHVWELHRQFKSQNPGAHVAIAGLEAECKPGTDIRALNYRVILLSLFVEACQHENLLPPVVKVEEFPDVFFEKAAHMQAEWIEKGVRNGFPFDAQALFLCLQTKSQGKQ